MTQHTPLPWTSGTIIHLALAEDVDFAVRAVNSHDDLLAALANLCQATILKQPLAVRCLLANRGITAIAKAKEIA